MQHFISVFYRFLQRAISACKIPFDKLITATKLYGNNVVYSKFRTRGIPKIIVEGNGKFFIGSGFKMNNREMANPIGRFNACSFVVRRGAKLCIGNNVGISSSAIYCQKDISIGDNVNIGGNVVIYDTDFHSKSSNDRLERSADIQNTITKSVKICDNVFIGAHSTILKGVTIGQNSIVGACSVVTKDIPSNEIWAGNPAHYIGKV